MPGQSAAGRTNILYSLVGLCSLWFSVKMERSSLTPAAAVAIVVFGFVAGSSGVLVSRNKINSSSSCSRIVGLEGSLSGIFCFLLGCSSGIVVDGVGCLMLVHESVEHRFGVLVRGFSTGELFVGFFHALVLQLILCGFLVAGCAHTFSSLIGLDASDIATRGQRSFFFLFGGHGDVRSIGAPFFAYRLAGKSGWFSSPTTSGGLLPRLGDSSSNVPGLLVIEAPDSLYTGDVIRLVRSAITRHVGVPDVLLMVQIKISDVFSSER